MHLPSFYVSMISAWSLAGIYDLIATKTGTEIRVLVYAAAVIMVFSLYAYCRDSKETSKD